MALILYWVLSYPHVSPPLLLILHLEHPTRCSLPRLFLHAKTTEHGLSFHFFFIAPSCARKHDLSAFCVITFADARGAMFKYLYCLWYAKYENMQQAFVESFLWFLDCSL